MSLRAFHDEERVEAGEDILTLAVDFKALDQIEHVAGQDGEIVPMTDVVEMLFSSRPPIGLSSKVLWVMLQRHHIDLSLDQAAGLLLGSHSDIIGAGMYALLVRTMNLSSEAKGENPPMRRGALNLS